MRRRLHARAHRGSAADGTRLADALHRYPHAQLRVLFGMEYDVRSNDDAVPRDPESTIDRATGLPRHSLYGERHQPMPAMLRDVDAFRARSAPYRLHP